MNARIKELVEKVDVLSRTRYTTKRKLPRTSTVLRRGTQSTRKIARAIGAATGKPVSHTTVYRRLKAMGKTAKKSRKGPRLTDLHKKARVKFAQQVRRQKLHQCHVVFTDEAAFTCNDDCLNRWYWCDPKQDAPVHEYARESERVLAWVAIGKGFRFLHVMDDCRLTKVTYKSKVLDVALPALRKACRGDAKLYFQQDNAPCHRDSLPYLTSQGVRVLKLPWPAKSPDLSPAEEIWALLKAKVAQRGPTGREELHQFLREEFDLIPQSTIDAIAGRFEKKLRECVRLEGQVTRC